MTDKPLPTRAEAEALALNGHICEQRFAKGYLYLADLLREAELELEHVVLTVKNGWTAAVSKPRLERIRAALRSIDGAAGPEGEEDGEK